jgi:hypothetical protein
LLQKIENFLTIQSKANSKGLSRFNLRY